MIVPEDAPAGPPLALRLAINLPLSLAMAFVLAFPIGWLRLVHVQAINMAPTLAPDDRVMVRTLGPAPSRGDVVLYRSPLGNALRVGRIVAAAGDDVALDERGLVLGGCAASARPASGGYDDTGPGAGGGACSIEAAARRCDDDPVPPGDAPCPPVRCEDVCPPEACRLGADPEAATTDAEIIDDRCYFTRRAGALGPLHFPNRTVPGGHFFVLNDNRVDERDSRIYGAIPRAAVVGVASFVYYASDETGIRWDRMTRKVS